MEAKKKGSPVPEPAEVRAPHARRPLRPVVRAIVPMGLAAGLSLAGVGLWAAGEPSHEATCTRAAATSPADPFEIIRVAWAKAREKMMPKPVVMAGGLIPPAPPIAPTGSIAIGGEMPPVQTEPPPVPSAKRMKKPVVHKMDGGAADAAIVPVPHRTAGVPMPPRRDVQVDGGVKAPLIE